MRKIILGLFCVLALAAGCGKIFSWGQWQFSGTVELDEHNVAALVPGRLVTLTADEGDKVKRGQLLGTLDRYEQAARDFERTQRLFDKGGATRQAVELAQLAVEDQAIRSPVDGVVLVRVHELGEVVASGSPVLVIGDRSHIWVRIYVPEGQINRIRQGQEAWAHLDGLRQGFKGHITFIADKAEFTPRNVQTAEERVTQTFSVKITLDQPPEFLRPGVAADVTLQPA